MRVIGTIIGYIMLYGSGILLFIFWMTAMTHWLGGWGFVLGIFLCPGLVIFPAIYWIVEGVFPVMYFALWGVGMIGLIIAGLSSKKEDDNF